MSGSARDRAVEDIAARIFRESHVSSRPGQCESLEEIARDLRDLAGTPDDGPMRAAVERVVKLCDFADEAYDYASAELDTDAVRLALTNVPHEGNRTLILAAVRDFLAAPVAPGVAAEPPIVAEMLAEFHEGFGQPFGHGDVADSALRRRLHEEEHAELLDAFADGDLTAVAHELADVVYVAYGSAHSLGIPLDAVIAEVHRANMSKLDADGRPVLREDGKVLKSARFVPADVAAVLASVAEPPAPAAEPCQRESVTPSDDGTLTIDCATHGEVAVVRTGGTVDQVAAGESDAVEAAWAEHVVAAPAAVGTTPPNDPARRLLSRILDVVNRHQGDSPERAMEEIHKVCMTAMQEAPGRAGTAPADTAVDDEDVTEQWCVFSDDPDDGVVLISDDMAEVEEMAPLVLAAGIAHRTVSTGGWVRRERCSACGSVLFGGNDDCCDGRRAEIEAGEAVLAEAATERESIEDRAQRDPAFASELRAAQAYHEGLRDGFVRGSAEAGGGPHG